MSGDSARLRRLSTTAPSIPATTHSPQAAYATPAASASEHPSGGISKHTTTHACSTRTVCPPSTIPHLVTQSSVTPDPSANNSTPTTQPPQDKGSAASP